jgi:ribosome-associated protein
MQTSRLEQGWRIREDDLEFKFVRSSGPGGQNVNKVSTKVELRFKLAETSALTTAQKRRLTRAYPAHVTQSGDFVLSSDRHRSQSQNLSDAQERLADMLETIRHPPKPRVATKPSKASKRRRLDQKRRQSDLKKSRKSVE